MLAPVIRFIELNKIRLELLGGLLQELGSTPNETESAEWVKALCIHKTGYVSVYKIFVGGNKKIQNQF